MRAPGLLLLAALSASCASIAELGYLASDPREKRTEAVTARELPRVERYPLVSLSSEAPLACSRVDRPFQRTAKATAETHLSNGDKEMMLLMTMVDGAVLGTVAAVAGGVCIQDGAANCPLRNRTFLLVFSPLAIDFAWGVFRSLTIRPPAYLSLSVAHEEERGEEIIK
jgi:hypothetical protein